MENPAKPDVRGDLEGAHLIIVEDDAILLMDLEAVLRRAGAKILRLCRTVEEGLTAAEMEGISAALLDVRVGRHPVAPVARRLFQRGIPFVFYTGQPSDDPAIVEWPHSRLVTKPARPQTIVSAILDVVRELKAADNRHMRAADDGASSND
jgi:DNA-binding NtrC family response regulator